MDPDYPSRSEAVARTLECDNRFTLESITFALNQQLHQLTPERIAAWIPETISWDNLRVGVVGAGNIPFVDFADYLAVVAGGGNYVGAPSSRSPFLLKAFSETAASLCEIEAEFNPGSAHEKLERVLESADVVIATGTAETGELITSAATNKGIQSILLRKPSYSIALLDGKESASEMEALAEDVFLHDGLGCRSVATIFAPESMSVDSFLEAANNFRSVFPAHDATRDSLKQTISLLEATRFPCAYPDDRSFLVSRGEPGVFGAGHVRWSPYSELDSVMAWLAENEESLQLVVTGERLASTKLTGRSDLVRLGYGQRPELEWMADGLSTVDFLKRCAMKSTRNPSLAD